MLTIFDTHKYRQKALSYGYYLSQAYLKLDELVQNKCGTFLRHPVDRSLPTFGIIWGDAKLNMPTEMSETYTSRNSFNIFHDKYPEVQWSVLPF